MSTAFVPAEPEEAHLLSEFRQKVWATTYRGIYPDDIIDNFDFEFHDSRNLEWINSGEYLVFFITENDEKAGYAFSEILKETGDFMLDSLRGSHFIITEIHL